MSSSTKAPVAIVLAAGKGTRMKSRTNKVLFELLGRPIVQRVVDAAEAAGCSEVVVVIGHQADDVRDALSGVTFAIQEGMQGTGQAVQAAREGADFSGRPVLVLPGDVPLMESSTIAGLLDAHKGGVTVGTMAPDDPTGYGRVVRGEDGGVVAIVEHRDATEKERAIGEVNTSLYVFDGDFLFGAGGSGGAISALTTDNDQGEYLLTDVVAQAAREGQSVRGFLIEDAVQVAGVNDRRQLAALEGALRERINDRWMLAGVSMSDPRSIRIEESVALASDVYLDAGVELRGDTRLDSGVRVGPGCILTDSSVAEGATLGAYVVLTGARVEAGARVLPFTLAAGLNEKQPEQTVEGDRVRLGAGARVGPFSHLRQAADVGPSAHVGNFVELKKTRLAEGAKANHLAYLGDAEVGARSNIGAGVITCNYDGFAKHKTLIGEDAFVGTDSHLIAPVRLGKGAYVATGTTVTRDVPADGFAIGRARQENKEGYAPRIKKHLKRRAESAKARAAGGSTPPTAPDSDST